MSLRLFYAVNFLPKIVTILKSRQNSLHRFVIQGSWSRPENFHITLHFIGRAEEEELPLFKAVLDRAAKETAPFHLTFDRYGSFRQRIGELIYIRTEDRDGGLVRLSRLIKEETDRGDRRPLKPHVTLVRKARIPYARLKQLEKERPACPSLLIQKVELMESRSEGGRLVYRSLHSVSLKGSP